MIARAWLALALALGAAPAQTPVQRPRDPWVFRSVLDERPRMVTIALSNDMWVAYDATWCSLYKAWKGGVHFDGAVYTTVHGPQPTSEGAAFVQGADGLAWSAVTSEGKPIDLPARWRGYSLLKGGVQLKYELALPGGGAVLVEEWPEFVRPEKEWDDPASQAGWLAKGMLGLRRTFSASGIPPGWKIGVRVQADCAGYLMESLSAVSDVELALPDGTKGRRLSATLPLDAAAPTNRLDLFFRSPPEPKGK